MLLSLYHDFKNLRNIITCSFEEWIDQFPIDTSDNTWTVFKPQSWFLSIDNKIAVDFLGKYEKLDGNWEKIGEKIGLKLPKLEKTRSSNHKPYMELYNNRTIKIIKNIYREDFEMFGHI